MAGHSSARRLQRRDLQLLQEFLLDRIGAVECVGDADAGRANRAGVSLALGTFGVELIAQCQGSGMMLFDRFQRRAGTGVFLAPALILPYDFCAASILARTAAACSWMTSMGTGVPVAEY